MSPGAALLSVTFVVVVLIISINVVLLRAVRLEEDGE
jgi:hypothetical protein